MSPASAATDGVDGEREVASVETAGDRITLVELDEERRAELEEERRFLLTSLADLEREHEAGDLDDADYEELRSGYTARAADVLRELDAGTEAVTVTRRRWKPMLIALAATVGVFGVLWWGLSTFSAQRLPEQTITGVDPRSERQQLLSQAYQVQFERPDEAAALYQLVLDEYPNDVEALTYGGWTRSLAVVRADVDSETRIAELSAGAAMLTEAIELDPTYPDPLCLRGVLYGRFLERGDLALADLDACMALNPPTDMRDLIGGLSDELRAAEGASGSAAVPSSGPALPSTPSSPPSSAP